MENTNKIIEELVKVLSVIDKGKMELGKDYIFECPLCNGKLHGKRDTFNGHLHLFCEDCKFSLME